MFNVFSINKFYFLLRALLRVLLDCGKIYHKIFDNIFSSLSVYSEKNFRSQKSQ